MKKITIFLFLFPMVLLSQTIVVSVGVGSYRMEDIKELRSFVVSNTPIALDLVEDFPPHIYCGAKVTFGNNNLQYGLGYRYYTTGSRYTLSDYSGRYDMDFIFNGHAALIPLQSRLAEFNGVDIGVYSNLELVFTKLKMKNHIELYEESYDDAVEFSSLNYGVEPGVYVAYPLNTFSLALHMGYNIGLGGKLKNEDGDELRLSEHDYIKTGWSGFRLELSVAYSL